MSTKLKTLSIIAPIESLADAELAIAKLSGQAGADYELVFASSQPLYELPKLISQLSCRTVCAFGADPFLQAMQAAQGDYLYFLEKEASFNAPDALAILLERIGQTTAQIVHFNVKVDGPLGKAASFPFRRQPFAHNLTGYELRSVILWVDDSLCGKFIARDLCQKVCTAKEHIGQYHFSSAFLNTLFLLSTNSYRGLDYTGVVLNEHVHSAAYMLTSSKQFFDCLRVLAEYYKALQIETEFTAFFEKQILERFTLNLGYACNSLKDQKDDLQKKIESIFGYPDAFNALIWAGAYNAKKIDTIENVFKVTRDLS